MYVCVCMECLLMYVMYVCEWNAYYFIEIAFIDFTLHEIKQCIVFLGTPSSHNKLFSRSVERTLQHTESR